jgi:D-xylose transport system substrate-binding protein
MILTSRRGGAAALAAFGLVALAACGSDNSSSSSGSSSGSGGSDAKRACVMLPDADSSSRWENGDRPSLTKAFEAEGFTVDIQNALNDTGKYATLAQQQMAEGCDVALLVDLNGAGVQVASKAKAQGVPVIAYDRPIKGADYYISFDNFHVGELEGQMIVDGLKKEGMDPASASVVYVGGDPTDGNAKQFHDGADSVMSKAGIKPAFETPGTWDQTKVAPAFEQAYTALQGKIDAVWAANDTNASVVIQVLDKNGKKVPVSGQDATPVGLQNVLLGKQAGTVYKPFQLEAQAAVDLAVKLANGEKPTVSDKAPDGTPFIPQTPTVVTADNMDVVFKDGNAKVSDVCKGPVADACKKAGIS